MTLLVRVYFCITRYKFCRVLHKAFLVVIVLSAIRGTTIDGSSPVGEKLGQFFQRNNIPLPVFDLRLRLLNFQISNGDLHALLRRASLFNFLSDLGDVLHQILYVLLLRKL